MPVLSNGHLGVQIRSDSIYMNGLYNGKLGLSHRARIPNYSNIQIEIINHKNAIHTVEYLLNVKYNYFKTIITIGNYKIIHLLYVHRYYNRAIINQIFIEYINDKGEH